MSDRQRISLSAPPDVSDLGDFPSRDLSVEETFHRVGRRRHGPWWFSSGGDGRFDLPSPHGTCYLAADAFGAILEAIGPSRQNGWIGRSFFADRVLWQLQLPNCRRAADTTERRAVGFGVTGEMGSLPNYRRCQEWAEKLHQAGFTALVYRLRHDPAGSEGVAVFDQEGPKAWPRGPVEDFLEPLFERLEEECGLKIAPAPRLDQLPRVEA